MRQFVDILPASLEEPVLFQTISAYADAERISDGMLKHKRNELPALGKIYWEGLEPQTLGEMCYCKGLDIDMSG